MTTLTNAQIQQLWINNGGSAALAPTMAAIAEAESSGNPQNLNNTPSTGDYSVGLWQINYYGNLYNSRTAEFGSPGSLSADPNAQARAAIALYNQSGLGNWTTYTSGAYKQYLSGSSAVPSGTVTGSPAGSGTSSSTSLTTAANALATEAAGGNLLPGASGPGVGGLVGSIAGIGSPDCLISTPNILGIGGGCLLSKAEGKVILGALLIGAGGLILTVGAIILAAYGLQRSGAMAAANRSIGVVYPPARAVARAAKGSGTP